MKNFLKAIRFLRAQQNSRYTGVTIEEIVLETPKKKFFADVYSSAQKSKNKKNPVILFLHGMSLKGYRDPRQVNLLQALSYSGFTVIAPSFEELSNVEITADSIYDLQSIVPVVLDRYSIEKVALFSVSFSGSICLSAAMREGTNNLISSVCTVGSFSDTGSTLKFLFTSEKCDSFARHIILKNYIELSIGKNPEVIKAIDASIADNWHKTDDKLPAAMAEISEENRDLVNKLLYDSKFREEKFLEARANGMKGIEDAYNIYELTHQLKSSIVLFHGDDDLVIDPNQSKMFFEHLQKASIPSALCISPFLGHGEAEVSMRFIKPLLKLLTTFRYFFSEVEKGFIEKK